MNTREAINKLRAQGLTDTQILDTLFPDREQEQPNQDPQDDQDPGNDDAESDEPEGDSDQGEGDQGEGDQSSDPSEDEGDDNQGPGQGDESSEDSDDQGNEGPNSDQGQNTEPEDDSDRDSDAGNQEDAQDSDDNSADDDAQNLSWGGNSLPEGYTPDAPTPDAIREASKALHRWIKASLGGKQASSRRDATKLCVRMTSRASLAHTHKLENTKKRLLVVIDVSISCSEYAPQYMQVAAALARAEKRLAVLVHSNGIPLELTVDGRQRPLTQFASNSAYMNLFNSMKEGLRNEVSAGGSLRKTEFDRLWQLLNGLNLQGVLALGDSDATVMLEYLSEQANVCYLCRTRGDVKTAQTYRQARRLSEKGCIPVLGGESVRSILKAINKLPAH